MAVYDLPATLRAASWEFGLARSGTQFRSPYTGTLQAVDFVADRWQAGLMLPPYLASQAGAAEAFFNRLVGGVNRVRLWHQARPVPAGTLRGSPTLSSSAARGNASIAITGATAHPNLMPGSSFEVDTNADGLADGWTTLTGGTTGSVTYSGASALSSPGTRAQRVTAAGLGTAATDFAGFYSTSPVAMSAGQGLTLAADVSVSNTCDVRLRIEWLDAGLSQISAAEAVSAGPVATVARRSLSATAPATTAWARLIVLVQDSSATASRYMDVDNLQVEIAPAATAYAGFPTLRAGDMLGAGGQLFQVADDVTLSDLGAGTVNVVNRVRAAISSAAAVTWLRPTAEFYLPSPVARFAHQPGVLTPVAFDLEEFIA